MSDELQCPICRSTMCERYVQGTVTAQEYFTGESAYRIAEGDNVQLDVYRCTQCGHGFSSLDVSEQELQAWYAAAPHDELFLQEEAPRRKTAAQVLARLERKTSGRRLLDIGCGPGLFVSEAAKRGWHADGIDASQWSIDYAQKRWSEISFHCGGVDEVMQMPRESYDVVTAFDVIEHIKQPAQLIEAARHVLKPNGILLLTTPRFDSVTARLMGRRWYCIFPAHIHLFSHDSLQRILRQHGFEITNNRTHTRHLSSAYFLDRLMKLVFGRGVAAPLTLTLPINVGDEFETYAKRRP